MSSSRNQIKGVSQFWLSHTNAQNEPFVQIGISLAQSEQFQCLSNSTKLVYLYMTLEAKGNRQFKFPLSVAKRYKVSNSTLRRSADELEKAGFIKRVSGKTNRTPTDYEFIRSWKSPP